MAKKIATKKKTTKAIAEKKKPQLIKEGEYNVALTAEEMLSAIQILSFSKDMFEQVALESSKSGDEKSTLVWSARANLSMLLWLKLRDVASIGEPSSGELH